MEKREELKRDIESIDFSIYSLLRNGNHTRDVENYENAILLLEEQKRRKQIEFQKMCDDEKSVLLKKQGLYEELLKIAQERGEEERQFRDEIDLLEEEVNNIERDLEDLELLARDANAEYEGDEEKTQDIIETDSLQMKILEMEDQENLENNEQEWQSKKETLKKEIKGFDKVVNFGRQMNISVVSLEAIREELKEKFQEICDKEIESIANKMRKKSGNGEETLVLQQNLDTIRKELEELGLSTEKISECEKVLEGPVLEEEKNTEVEVVSTVTEKESETKAEKSSKNANKEYLISKFQEIVPKWNNVRIVMGKVEEEIKRRPSIDFEKI